MESEVVYHTYEELWSSVIEEVLVCHCDTRIRHDPLAVATFKGTTDSGRTRSYLDGYLRFVMFSWESLGIV